MLAKGGDSVANLQKLTLYNSNIDHVNDNVYTNILQILSKTQILTSIKGRNFFRKFAKMRLYGPNVDIVNDNMYTKFG